MAFKMKNQSMVKLTKAAGDSRVAMKMKAESAMKKELVGKQGNLPPELKAKIEAAPTKMKSAMKRAGYYEYDVDGNKQQITSAEYKEKSKKGTSSKATAGVADEKGKSGTLVADMSHGKDIIDNSSVSDQAKKSSKYKKDVEEGTKERGQRGTHKTTTRYKADKKNQDKFDKKIASRKKAGSAVPMKRKKEDIKKDLEGGRKMLAAKKNAGKPKKVGTSIYTDTYQGTGDTRATKKAEKKFAKAEKKLAKGNLKAAARKVKKGRKAVISMPSGPTTRS